MKGILEPRVYARGTITVRYLAAKSTVYTDIDAVIRTKLGRGLLFWMKTVLTLRIHRGTARYPYLIVDTLAIPLHSILTREILWLRFPTALIPSCGLTPRRAGMTLVTLTRMMSEVSYCII